VRLKHLSQFLYGITLPSRAIRMFKGQARQKLQITVDEKRKRLIIEDAQGVEDICPAVAH